MHNAPIYFDTTIRALSFWTRSSANAELLSAQVLLKEGFKCLDPSHPLGGPDGGKDALAHKDGRKWVMAVYFPKANVSYSDIKKKFTGDLEGVDTNRAQGFVFVTNQEITLAQRHELSDLASTDVLVEIYHLVRLQTVLDQPGMEDVRYRYLGVPPASGTLVDPEHQRTKYLLKLEHQLTFDRNKRLRAAGIEVDAVASIMDAVELMYPYESYKNIKQNDINVFVADPGSGKTEWSSQWMLNNIAKSRSDSSAPTPVWINARQASQSDSIQHLISARLPHSLVNNDAPSNIVIDGLDQMEPNHASKVLAAAELFIAQNPGSTVVATARPEPLLDFYHPQFIRPLTHDQGHLIVRQISGWSTSQIYHSLPQEIETALDRPLVAISVGILFRNTEDATLTKADAVRLLPQVIVRATQLRLTADLFDPLVAIAIHVVTNDSPYPIHLIDGRTLEALSKTPLLALTEQGVDFSLPIHEQYFASEALTRGKIDLSTILNDHRFTRWRYSVLLMLEKADDAEVSNLMAILARSNVAAASWIISEMSKRQPSNILHSARWATSSNDPDIDVKMSTQKANNNLSSEGLGKLLRDSYDCLREGIGTPLNQNSSLQGWNHPPVNWVVHVNTEHHMLVLIEEDIKAVNSVRSLTTEEWSILKRPNSIQNFAPEQWIRMTQEGLPTGPMSHWSWAQRRMKADIERAIEGRLLYTRPYSILDVEKHLAVISRIARHTRDSTLSPQEMGIPVDNVRNAIDTILRKGDDNTWYGGDYSTSDLRNILQWSTDYPGDYVRLNQPSPDRSNPSWAWQFYSPDRLREYVSYLIKESILGYKELVECNFPKSKWDFRSFRNFPVRVDGRLICYENDDSFESSPVFYYVISRLSDQEDSVTSHVDHQVVSDRDDFDHNDIIATLQERAANFDAEPVMWVTTGDIPSHARTPVSNWAYNRLVGDLSQYSLCGSLKKPKDF